MNNPKSPNATAGPATSIGTTGFCLKCQGIVPLGMPQAVVEVLLKDEFKGYLHLRCRAEWEAANRGFTYGPVQARLHFR